MTSAMASLDVDAYSLNDVQTIDAEYWITNRRAVADGTSTLEIASNRDGITDANGLAITDIVPNERDATTTDGNYNTVFWQARVQHVLHQTTGSNDDKTQDGTEITRIRYTSDKNGKKGKFEYCAKGSSEWTKFNTWTDQLVFYYLIRTEYSQMVQIDVSDWTVDKEDTQYSKRRSVTYQVYVEDGNEDGTDEPVASRTFWYNKAFTVSSVRVREIGDHPNYSIDRVALDPLALGTVTDENGEYRFSLDLRETERNATVKIYVTPNVQPVQLTYDLDGGTITSADGTYSLGSVYPHAPITTPTVEKDNCIFEGWYTDADFVHKWEDHTMPNHDLTLYAKFTAKETPKPEPEPEPELTPAKYFVLLPTRGVPKSSESQGPANYLPNTTSDGGVTGRNAGNGYEGYLTEAGKAIADAKYTGYDATNGYTKIDNVGVESKYLLLPTNLGFFTKANWNGANYTPSTNVTDITALLGEKFNPQIAEVVWYTIKKQSDGYHVDGYVKNVDVTVTYHSNFGDTEQTKICTATTGTNYEALDYADTKLPTRENYTFGGWYTDKNCTTAYETTTLMTSLDLYAKWVPNKFDVSYFVNNEKYGETEKHDVDSTVTVKAAPTKTGYTFSGWTPAADSCKHYQGC